MKSFQIQHLLQHRLPRNFYAETTTSVAQNLLGKIFVHVHHGQVQAGKIVEVEAYLGPHDLAAHSAKGLTPRTKVMFGPPGHLYVYLIYGIYHCANVVTEEEGHASAVLIRAIEPLQNIHLKTSGPGLLCNALGITKALNGSDLLSDTLFLCENEELPKFQQVKRPRIGVNYAKHWAKRLLRFYIKNNPYVSRK